MAPKLTDDLAVYKQNSNFVDVVDYITSQTLKGT
ncbi:MAG: hypothetical protein JWQ63_944 [Mucilaginibacter sp.]|nr:hypothetical protein [Mucilaginibacter sp.]